MLLAGLVMGAAAWWWQRNQATDNGSGGALDSALETVNDWTMQTVGFGFMDWTSTLNKPENADYKDWLTAAELNNAIPSGMLARLAYQESHFRPDIISGKKQSSAGAIGIMQIIPRWNPGVNPYDAQASISYAGRKLAGLYRMFNSWELALQAYNWGEGNLKKYLAGKIASLPAETANYSKQILADIGGGVYA